MCECRFVKNNLIHTLWSIFKFLQALNKHQGRIKQIQMCTQRLQFSLLSLLYDNKSTTYILVVLFLLCWWRTTQNMRGIAYLRSKICTHVSVWELLCLFVCLTPAQWHQRTSPNSSTLWSDPYEADHSSWDWPRQQRDRKYCNNVQAFQRINENNFILTRVF